MFMMRNARYVLIPVLLMLPLICACSQRQRPRETIYILNRDIKAGEILTKSIVDEIGYTDHTGGVDLINAVNLLTPSNLEQHLGRKFSEDAPQFTPLSADLLAPDSP